MHFGNRTYKNNKGFTLVELMITVAILALVTAPFLSSFVSASRANATSKRIQEANELNEYIMEQFKATSPSKLITTYNFTETKAKVNGSNKESIVYTRTMSSKVGDVALPTGYRKGYSAEITLTPTNSVVNGDYAVPVIDNLNKKYCAVLNENITKFDKTGATKRDVIIEINRDSATNKYLVKLTVTVTADDGSGPKPYVNNISWKYDTIPTVYVLYKPISTTDTITVKNMLFDTNDLTEGGSRKTVNVYLINQKKDATGAYYNNISPAQISMYEARDAVSGDTYSLSNLVDKTQTSAKLINTTLYTNIATFSTDKIDSGVNSTVKMIKIDTAYDLDVTINYNGKKVSDYKTTKIMEQ